MKFISLQENLKQGLQIVSHVVSKNINLPILNNILVKANKGNIELIATNLEIGIIHQVRGKIEVEGEFTVDSKIITDYINLLPSAKVEIDKNDSEIKVECENYKTKINIQEATDFPLLPVVAKDNPFILNLNDFRDALSQVLFSVANNETRLELSGVLFIFNDNEITLVGTDSYRLTEKKILLKNKSDNNFKIIVPAKALQELFRILSSLKEKEDLDSSGDISICLSENQILFSFGGTELVSRLIMGNFPDYKQIIPTNFKTEVKIDKSSLLRAIKASAIFSKTGINDVTMDFKKEDSKIFLSSISSQTGESSIDLKAEISGDDNSMVVNYRYLLDGLNNIDGPNIVMELVNGNTPCVLKAEKDETYQYIVMPIRQ
ncbi:MAG: DNA polymerase III subunit beta [Candidatus Falkowbacteria bacterium]